MNLLLFAQLEKRAVSCEEILASLDAAALLSALSHLESAVKSLAYPRLRVIQPCLRNVQSQIKSQTVP